MQLIIVLLRTLASIAADETLGSKGRAIKSVLDLAAVALERGEEGAEQFRELVAQVQAMVAGDRDPTPEEWDALKLRSDKAHATIQGWQE